MKILITGIDGYTGWPLIFTISKRYRNSKIIGVDNLQKEDGYLIQIQLLHYQSNQSNKE